MAFLWSVIQKTVAVNKWRHCLLNGVDESWQRLIWVAAICCSPIMESVEHRFFSCPLAQQVCCYVANIIWQLFAKQGNLGPWKSSSMMQCLFDQPLSKSLNSFSCIWFFSRSGLPWIIWHQRSDLSSNALQWPMEKYTKLHGTPYLPMADLSGNEPSRIWKKH